MELISNGIKARYLHIITIKCLKNLYPSYNQKIDKEEADKKEKEKAEKEKAMKEAS